MQTGSIWSRSVLVTGASRGIGRGIARVFARAGAKVLIVARDGGQAEAAAEEITAAGGVATAFTADVTNAEQMREAARTAATRHGGLDVLCANAGIFPQATLEDMKPELWDEVMSTNLKGTFLSVQACVPCLKNSDQGRIVLTSSITGRSPVFLDGRITGRPRPASSASCARRASSSPSTESPSTPCCPAISSRRACRILAMNT